MARLISNVRTFVILQPKHLQENSSNVSFCTIIRLKILQIFSVFYCYILTHTKFSIFGSALLKAKKTTDYFDVGQTACHQVVKKEAFLEPIKDWDTVYGQ